MSILSALLETSVYAAILYLTVTLFKCIFQKKLSSFLHFALWLLVVARLCVPVTLESGFHLFTVEQKRVGDTGSDGLSMVKNDGQTAYHAPGTLKGEGTAAATGSDAFAQRADSDSISPVITPVSPWFTWTNALLVLWMMGMITRLSTLYVNGLKLSRAVRENGLAPDKRLSCIYVDCAKRLELRRIPKLKLLAGIASPALTISFSPVVVMPIGLAENFSDEQLTFALLHELTHFKRDDHLLSLLMHVLEAMYWFNPIVWLTGRGLSRDMETACDGAVSALLTKNGRKEYALTLLSLFSQERRESYVLGMTLSTVENDAQRRIHSLFRSQKSQKGVKAAAFALSLVLLLSCFTTACQPTLEQEVVITKGDGAHENAVAQTPAVAEMAYDAPSHYTDSDSYFDGLMQMTFDMDVTVPGATRYPIYAATPADFTQEQVTAMVNALVQGVSMLSDDDRPTKAEIMEHYLLPAKQKLEAAKNGEVVSDDSGVKTVEELQELVDATQAWYDSAPESNKSVPITAAAYSDTDTFLAKAELGKVMPAKLRIYKGTGRGSGAGMLEFINGTEYIYNGFEDPASDLSLTTTRDEAVAIATELVKSMGATDFALAAVGKTTRLGNEYDIGTEEYQGTMAYSVVFTRVLDNIPFGYCYIDSPGFDETETVTSTVPPYERIMVIVDDTGVANVFWQGNLKIGKKLNENVTLLQFDQIMEHAKQQIKVEYAWLTDTGGEENSISTDLYELTITRAELRYMAVRTKNSLDYTMIPVWDFYGKEVRHYNHDDVDAFNRENPRDDWSHPYDMGKDYYYYEYLTLNAIDGSVINRALGY